jgi:hypothetical protein
MTLTSLNCPNCGHPLSNGVASRQPIKCQACGSLFLLSPREDEKFPNACPKCETVNSANQRYCKRCGTKLLVDCPVCYRSNSTQVEFCEGCGTNIQEEIHRREAWNDTKAKNDQRRKSILEKAEQDDQRREIARNIADLSEPERHSFAIFSLSRIGLPAVEPLIETMLEDPDPDARYAAARALGLIGDKKAIPHLTAALFDPDPAVRYCAIEALDAMGAVSEEVEKLTKDKFKWVRERARKALDSQVS